MRIIVAGLVGAFPVGGVAWDYLQYVIGLHRMGHDVYYYEDSGIWPYDPERRSQTSDPTYSLRFLRAFFSRHEAGMGARWRYSHPLGDAFGVDDHTWGPVLESADVFLNVSGASAIPATLRAGCRRVFIDTDPGYNQIVLAERPGLTRDEERWCDAVYAHDQHFTYAENIAADDCLVPDVGIRWQPTRMPVCTELWRDIVPPRAGAPWTTVMSWSGFKGPVRYQGREYRSKDGEFEKLMDLPTRTRQQLAIAVGGDRPPLERMRVSGWQVLDGPEVTRTPESYRSFIADSAGEISIAKHVYVALRTGWFSTRTACYLAAGRPAVVQDTGFGHLYSTGRGLFAFDDPDGALAGVEEASGDLAAHGRDARDLAEAHFAAPNVLGRLLSDIDAGQ